MSVNGMHWKAKAAILAVSIGFLAYIGWRVYATLSTLLT